MSKKKLTALWHSNAPWGGTGYSTQTKQAVERFQRDGHHIAVNANYGLQGTKMIWEDIPIFPMGVEAYSNDTVRANFAAWTKENPDGVPHAFCLFDAWTMLEEMWKDVPVSVWTMVDHMPVPPRVLQTLQRPNVSTIAVTKFGQEQIQRAGIEAVYIPMAIESGLYKPSATYEGRRGRDLMRFDDDVFVVSAINANKSGSANGPHRKAWGENILAFSIFAQNHDDVRLYLHTERYGNHQGLALDFLLKACGLKPDRHYKFVSQHAMNNGIPNEAMAAIYADTDVLLAPTMGEGFGLTVLEAQLAGTVAIVNNFSAQPELLGDGWLTEGQPFWDGGQLAWFNTPNVPSIVDALEQAYARGKGRSEKARAHALQYDADKVWADHWRPYIKTLTA
jgi:glycosyltransferase involved in cell wall biosynthesis